MDEQAKCSFGYAEAWGRKVLSECLFIHHNCVLYSYRSDTGSEKRTEKIVKHSFCGGKKANSMIHVLDETGSGFDPENDLTSRK
jgi:hypothetical protein